jgi:hypothetical protein
MSPSLAPFLAYGSYSALRSKFKEPKRFKRDDFPAYSSKLRLLMLADHIDGVANLINDWDAYYYPPGGTAPLNKLRLCDTLLARAEALRYSADFIESDEERDKVFTSTFQLMLNFIQELKSCSTRKPLS